jgi:(p)ppGpp synthase/HD superfamily hydrolase
VEDLLAGMGYGEVTLNQVVNKLRETTVKTQQPEITISTASYVSNLPPSSDKGKSPIAGVEGLLYHIAGCCHPLPGEPIIGVVGRGAKGIAIHRQGCPNLDSVTGERLIPVKWNPQNGNNGHTYPVDILIEAIDRVGVLKDILLRLTDCNINVRNAGVKTGHGKPAMISLQIDIRDHQQLENIIAKIKNMSDILDLRRVTSVEVA